MSVRTCNHIRKNGRFCQLPALHGRDFCYFHLTNRARRQKASRARRRGENIPVSLPFPEDIYSIQVCLHEVMVAIAEKRIESKEAGQILYFLQQASVNIIASGATLDGLGNLDDEYSDAIPVRACPSLEEEFELPEGLDLTPDLDDNLLDDEEPPAPPRKLVAPELLAQKASEPAA